MHSRRGKKTVGRSRKLALLNVGIVILNKGQKPAHALMALWPAYTIGITGLGGESIKSGVSPSALEANRRGRRDQTALDHFAGPRVCASIGLRNANDFDLMGPLVRLGLLNMPADEGTLLDIGRTPAKVTEVSSMAWAVLMRFGLRG